MLPKPEDHDFVDQMTLPCSNRTNGAPINYSIHGVPVSLEDMQGMRCMCWPT